MRRADARIPTLLLSLLLCACAGAGPVMPGEGGKSQPPPDTVDYTCRSDADCEVKNVGNCCGYYPACVNRDSPTFPERVKAECEREGRMGICGFPALTGCRCVDQRCEGITGAHDGATQLD